jgi:hypothetical protein
LSDTNPEESASLLGREEIFHVTHMEGLEAAVS